MGHVGLARITPVAGFVREDLEVIGQIGTSFSGETTPVDDMFVDVNTWSCGCSC